ncbi:cyclophilin-like fold protein [Actinoplanes sp. CA-142083]|uniref:cyclophilin-like fold protein n=1 Tax=Actinoplanes sp. CA-142083 TaxID=3239903 RepID=UPI003D89EFFA
MTVLARGRAALMTVALVAVLAGCGTASASGIARLDPSAAGPDTGTGVLLRFGDHVATATLTDTPESRQFAAMLPATVDLRDVWAQAKSGRLPRSITIEGSTPVHDPVPGDIYFWPTTDVLAIYYADLGQAVPDPGLVRLGALDTGLDDLGNSGRRAAVRIELADPARRP